MATTLDLRTRLAPVGGWRPTLLRVGTLPVDRARLRGDDALATGRVPMPINALLLERPGLTLLVDAGPGPLAAWWEGASATAVAAQPALAAAVDLIVLTHLDFDHVGGLFDGDWPDATELVFPRARVVALAAAVAAARAADPTAERNAATRTVDLLAAHGALEEAGDGAELAPQVRLRAAPGHRAGHAYVEVAGDDGPLLYLADALHDPSHVAEPELDVVSDADPGLALETRRRLIRLAADRGATVVASHLPGPGHVETREDGAMTWKD